MEPTRRLAVFLLALAVSGFLVGGGAQVTLALMTDTAAVNTTFTTASSFDIVAPTISRTVVSKTTAYWPSYIKQSGTYYIYAQVTDGGAVPSGVATVTANTSSVDAGQTAVPLVAGSYSIGGVSYNYRSGSKSVTGTLAEGTYTFSVTATDVNGNAATLSGQSVTVDNTKPSTVDVATANAGVAGRPEAGDTITLTFSELIDPESIDPGWTGASTSVVVRITQNTSGDRVTIRNAANSAQLSLGSVNLVGLNYVTATRDFGASGTPSTMVAVGNTIVITLGTASGAVGTESVSGVMVWTPATAANDRANNACLATVANESGALDLDF